MEKMNAIEVRNVKKTFRLYKDKGNSLKEKVLFKERNKYDVRTVLKGISFDIKKGEVVGLIGHNGCGKSTTLKLLTKIIYPDSGSIGIQGRVSSLLELGAGFHPDMSGRDNIYINASIFGLTRKEIDDRLDDIIEFSELGHYIDNPVRTYSSGMYMRLAFSVAINVNADVILIDEILSVGDLNFQAKCLKQIQKIKNAGTTIVIVSHALGPVESICDRCIWLNDGVIVEDGVPGYVHRKYLEFMGEYNFHDSAAPDVSEDEIQQTEVQQENIEEVPVSESEVIEQRFERKGSGELRIKRVICIDAKGEEKHVFATDEDILVAVDLKMYQPADVDICFSVLRSDYMLCYGTRYYAECKEYIPITKDQSIIIKFPKIDLLPSQYMLDLRIVDKDGNDIDVFNEAVSFQIYCSSNESGMFKMKHEWIK